MVRQSWRCVDSQGIMWEAMTLRKYDDSAIWAWSIYKEDKIHATGDLRHKGAVPPSLQAVLIAWLQYTSRVVALFEKETGNDKENT